MVSGNAWLTLQIRGKTLKKARTRSGKLDYGKAFIGKRSSLKLGEIVDHTEKF